jgi:hypothetical protein
MFSIVHNGKPIFDKLEQAQRDLDRLAERLAEPERQQLRLEIEKLRQLQQDFGKCCCQRVVGFRMKS